MAPMQLIDLDCDRGAGAAWAVLALALFGCGGGAASAFVDPRDGHAYSRVEVGSATWMGENLDWEAPEGSFCYEDSAANCASGGRLYTFAAAASACPTGWHLSTDDEWKKVEASLGMPVADLDIEAYSLPRGTDEGTRLKIGGTSGLDFPMTGYAQVGTDGHITLWDGLGGSGGDRTYVWTPASAEPTNQMRRRLDDASPLVFRFSAAPEGYAITVRCVADQS